MQLLVDTHTHTWASGHAYSTIVENTTVAHKRDLKMICTTDHGPAMPDTRHEWFYSNQKILPRFISGVAVIRGVEANIMDQDGDIDIRPRVASFLDWVMAGFHEPVYSPASSAEHTRTLIKVIESGRVDALVHMGNPNFDFDYETVIACMVENNVAIEINNASLMGVSRSGSTNRCRVIIEHAARLGAYITTGSDAHFCEEIGRLAHASDLLDAVGADSSKVITHTPQQFLDFLKLRGRDLSREFEEF